MKPNVFSVIVLNSGGPNCAVGKRSCQLLCTLYQRGQHIPLHILLQGSRLSFVEISQEFCWPFLVRIDGPSLAQFCLRQFPMAVQNPENSDSNKFIDDIDNSKVSGDQILFGAVIWFGTCFCEGSVEL